ncbi:MAG: glycosyltransferase family protein [Polaromonas sp.]
MAAIFLATEADEGMGHIAPWFSFVAQALKRNHRVHMAAPDVGLLNQLIGDKLNIGVWPSPRWRPPGPTRWGSASFGVRNWPELLVSLGYAQPFALGGALKAWYNILRHVRPSVIVADYAPALMLAARVLDIPVLEVGGGFCVPPLAPQVQSFPGVRQQDPSRVAQADEALTTAFNRCLAQFGKPALLRSICDLQLWPASRVVLSPPELDHYGVRSDVVYAGLLKATAGFDSDVPPIAPWPRVVGYLKVGTPGLDSLIDQMAQAQIPARIYISGSSNTEPRQHGSVTLTYQAIRLTQALDQAGVYLSNGGLHGVGLALQKGCWPVVVPQQAEQVAMARNLVRRNWGGLWMADSPHMPQKRAQEVFAAHPRQVRLPADRSAEEMLFQLIGGLA